MGAGDNTNLYRKIKSVIPGFEVSNMKDIPDIINGSRTNILSIIDHLEKEYSNIKSNSLNFGTLSPIQGAWWPEWSPRNDFPSLQAKQAAIKSMLKQATNEMDNVTKYDKINLGLEVAGGVALVALMVAMYRAKD